MAILMVGLHCVKFLRANSRNNRTVFISLVQLILVNFSLAEAQHVAYCKRESQRLKALWM